MDSIKSSSRITPSDNMASAKPMPTESQRIINVFDEKISELAQLCDNITGQVKNTLYFEFSPRPDKVDNKAPDCFIEELDYRLYNLQEIIYKLGDIHNNLKKFI
jgi:hypothetical protein